MLELVDLVVQGLEADAQLAGGGRLAAVVFLEDGLDVAHLDVTEGGVALGDLEVGCPDRRGCGRVGPAPGGELGRQAGKRYRSAGRCQLLKRRSVSRAWRAAWRACSALRRYSLAC